MIKFGYFFDWQENKGYEDVESHNKQSKEAGKVELGLCKTKKLRNKNSNHNNIRKSSVTKGFELRAASGLIK